MFGIDALGRRIDRRLDAIEGRLLALSVQLKGAAETMPTQAEFDAAIANVKTAIADANARVVSDIQALKDQLAAGDPITAADLDALASTATAAGQIDPAVVPPSPPGP